MSHAIAHSPWLEPIDRRRAPNLRLFCFPFVGADANIFRAWTGQFPDTIEVIGLQYPGRGRRFTEPPLTSLSHLEAQILEAITPFLDVPFALFGHSMGGIVSFQLAQLLEQRGQELPRCIFVSGSKPPHERLAPSELTGTPISKMSDEEFIAELTRLNGTPNELLSDKDALRHFLPMLRADFRILETADYRSKTNLNLPISAFCGTNDQIAPLQSMMLWKDLTRATFRFQLIPGDHFFLLRSRRRLLESLIPQLEQLANV